MQLAEFALLAAENDDSATESESPRKSSHLHVIPGPSKPGPSRILPWQNEPEAYKQDLEAQELLEGFQRGFKRKP